MMSLTHELMIALYYYYFPHPIPPNVLSDHRSFHESLCTKLGCNGRIRVSSEGINGVLSGTKDDLMDYETFLKEELTRTMKESNTSTSSLDDSHCSDCSVDLDIKYCKLRSDIPADQQLFDSLSVKQTREVVSLYETKEQAAPGSKRRGGRRGRRWKKKQEQTKQHHHHHHQSGGDEHGTCEIGERRATSNNDSENCAAENERKSSIPTSPEDIDLKQYPPAPHLSPQEWNDKLQSEVDGDAILLDARNVYESRVGHFAVEGVPTILPNTRKYSSLPAVFDATADQLAGKNVYMYCTGGVRCERASAYLQALSDSEQWKADEKPREIYQLKGGIQRYLETYGTEISSTKPDDPSISNATSPCLYKGKNFVFDPRRTDPLIGPDCPGRCLICSVPHSDYDNSHAPCENKEARCCRCRVLVLVCNDCRCKVRIWGENNVEDNDNDEKQCATKPDLFCGPGGKECIDEGNNVSVQIV